MSDKRKGTSLLEMPPDERRAYIAFRRARMPAPADLLDVLRDSIRDAGETENVPLNRRFAEQIADALQVLQSDNEYLRSTLDIGTRTIKKLTAIRESLHD